MDHFPTVSVIRCYISLREPVSGCAVSGMFEQVPGYQSPGMVKIRASRQ